MSLLDSHKVHALRTLQGLSLFPQHANVLRGVGNVGARTDQSRVLPIQDQFRPSTRLRL